MTTRKKVTKRATFTIYRTKHKNRRAGIWAWRLTINGVTIAASGEAFTRRRQAKRSIDRLVAYTQSGRYRIGEF